MFLNLKASRTLNQSTIMLISSFRKNVKKVDSYPEMANQIGQENEIQKLRHKVEELIGETKKLAQDNL